MFLLAYMLFDLRFWVVMWGVGGVLTDKDQPYTATALEKVMENVENATK